MFDKEGGPEQQDTVKKDLLFVLSKLLDLRKNFNNEPVNSPELVPGGAYKQNTQEEKDRLNEYKKSKFRVNWFSGVISYSDMLKNYYKEFNKDEELRNLIEDVDELDKDLKELRKEEDKPIPKEMVDRADSLLDKIIKKIPTLIK
ncbi:MAG: hypothetical protein ACYC3G_01095 [Minisyncoccota bacterium]